MSTRKDKKMAASGIGGPAAPDGGPNPEGTPAPEIGQPAPGGQVDYAALYQAVQQEAGGENPAVGNEALQPTSDSAEPETPESGLASRHGENPDEPERNEVIGNNINQRVIDLQKAAGWDVGPNWYDKYVTQIVGNSATEQQMLTAFTQAFNEHFPVGQDGQRHADDAARALGAMPIGAEARSDNAVQNTQGSSEARVVSFPQGPEIPRNLDKAA